jgi:3-deoxy-D-manno-octulosonate 8-phosphate phosphatase (KDO 8-P phosphatase)
MSRLAVEASGGHTYRFTPPQGRRRSSHGTGFNILSDQSIRLLILDVDGILTDGRLYIDETGNITRAFHIQDGLGVTLWRTTGRQAAILTSKRSAATLVRARMLGIDLVEQGAEDKLPGFERLLAATGVTAGETAYMGDDLLDAPVMRRVGYSITVPDAASQILSLARYVTSRPGGRGAVREAIEHLLNREGAWERAISLIGADR